MKANEFMKILENDPQYQEMIRRQDEELKTKIEESKIIEKPFIDALHLQGFCHINDIDELVKLKKADAKLINLILEWIPKIDNKYNSQEALVRSLAVTKKSFNGKVLMDLFDNDNSSHSLKWAIGNTIACTTIENISDWLENKLKASEQPTENQMLVYAAVKYFDENKARNLLRGLFHKHPLQVIDAFTYICNEEDIDFLLEKRQEANKNQKSAIDKAIKKITKRDNKSK